MTEKDNIQYIRVLLALNGNDDKTLLDTLDKAEDALKKKKNFASKFASIFRKPLQIGRFRA